MDQSGVEDCFSMSRVKGELLWGAFEAWPSIMWTVLSGPGCTKWTKVVYKTVLVGRRLRVSCYGCL